VKGRLEKEKRDIIPRWRTFWAATRSDAQLSSARISAAPKYNESDQDSYEAAVRDFDDGQSVWDAGDPLLMALARHDDATAKRIATFILAHQDEAVPSLSKIANNVLNPKSEMQDADGAKARIPRLRRRLSAFPRNAIAWADLALDQTLLGNFSHAERAMRAALHLAPDNRFILRSASRFYIHQDDLEQAHNLLARSSATPDDPWLLAAEIATARSAGVTSRFIKRAHNLLEGHNFHQHHLSELASAVGTTEGDSPTARRLSIRRLIAKSLVDPTENSVAQAQWHSTNTGFAPAFDKDPDSRELLRTQPVYEAQAWQAYIEGDFVTALDRAKKWFEDQPFSARPAFLVSNIASLLVNEPRTAIAIANRALKPNPHEMVLWNNLAYAHAVLGEIAEANDALSHVKESGLDATAMLYVTATKGAIAFRSGDPATGRALYIEAMNAFTDADGRKTDFDLFSLAFVHLAYEEAVAKTPEALELYTAALDISQKARRFDVTEVVKRTADVLKTVTVDQSARGAKKITLRLTSDSNERITV
jgi:tetratricopeptide (TPR) repeat protein